MKKGEIWLVDIFPAGGHEQEGARPAIILADTKTSVVIIVPCTANLQALRFPHTIRIEPTKRNGLDLDSIALVFHVRAIDKRKMKSRIGTLESQTMNLINHALKKLLAL